MSRFTVSHFLIMLVAIGASSATFARQEKPDTQEKVYLLRGLTNVLSPGIDQLANDLPRKNIGTTVTNHLFWNSLAAEAIQDCRSGRVDSIVLVGHSLGASAAVSMAEQLRQAGIRVALIVTFDPVTRTSVPSNVHLLENFYLSSGLGVPVQRGEHFHGLLRNVDLKNTELGHLSVTTSPSIQKQVMNDIVAAAKIRCR
jgi:pimeloyl-ACP methyl ester carboxylesterase